MTSYKTLRITMLCLTYLTIPLYGMDRIAGYVRSIEKKAYNAPIITSIVVCGIAGYIANNIETKQVIRRPMENIVKTMTGWDDRNVSLVSSLLGQGIVMYSHGKAARVIHKLDPLKTIGPLHRLRTYLKANIIPHNFITKGITRVAIIFAIRILLIDPVTPILQKTRSPFLSHWYQSSVTLFAAECVWTG